MIGRSIFLAILLGVVIWFGCGRDDGDARHSAEISARRTSELDGERLRDHPVISPNAKIETYELLREERANPPGPADGGGQMELERVLALEAETFETVWQREPASSLRPSTERTAATRPSPGRPVLPAASFARLEFVYTVGPLGIEEGGLLFFEADPFWEWSPAQSNSPRSLGFTTATPRAAGVVLQPEGRSAHFVVKNRRLEPGERVDVVYGAGPGGARVDRYAERGAVFLAGSDADGDGTRAWATDLPRIDIEARSGTQIVAFGPAEAAPGETIEIRVALLDDQGNAARWPEGAAAALSPLENASRPETAPVVAPAPKRASRSTRSFELSLSKSLGVLRYRVSGTGALSNLTADVNPIVVREASQRLRWADLHGHSQHSDGTGGADDYFRYARDIASLDAAALTDHDHWGIRPLDADSEAAALLLGTALEFHRPGEFVTIPGYEWTSWLHGHRHVLYFEDEAPIFSSLDPETDRPDELWKALRGRPALTFTHHSAGEPVATNWSFRPDPELETIAEIASVHGMSEAHDAPLPILGGLAGLFVRDTLIRGARLGFIGSGDSHDGHPGLAHLAAGPGRGGLAGLFASSLERGSLLETLRARRTFATNGIRPWFWVEIDGVPMGGELSAMPGAGPARSEHTLRIRYEATSPIESIELIRSGVVASLPGDGTLSLDLERTIPPLGPGEFHYVRIVQRDRGVAWSSPIFSVSRSDAPE